MSHPIDLDTALTRMLTHLDALGVRVTRAHTIAPGSPLTEYVDAEIRVADGYDLARVEDCYGGDIRTSFPGGPFTYMVQAQLDVAQHGWRFWFRTAEAAAVTACPESDA